MCSLDGRSGTNRGAIPGGVKRASLEGPFYISRLSTWKLEPPKVAAPFQQQNFPPRRRQLVRQRTPAWACTDYETGMGTTPTLVLGSPSRGGMELDDLLCSRNARPRKGGI